MNAMRTEIRENAMKLATLAPSCILLLLAALSSRAHARPRGDTADAPQNTQGTLRIVVRRPPEFDAHGVILRVHRYSPYSAASMALGSEDGSLDVSGLTFFGEGDVDRSEQEEAARRGSELVFERPLDARDDDSKDRDGSEDHGRSEGRGASDNRLDVIETKLPPGTYSVGAERGEASAPQARFASRDVRVTAGEVTPAVLLLAQHVATLEGFVAVDRRWLDCVPRSDLDHMWVDALCMGGDGTALSFRLPCRGQAEAAQADGTETGPLLFEFRSPFAIPCGDYTLGIHALSYAVGVELHPDAGSASIVVPRPAHVTIACTASGKPATEGFVIWSYRMVRPDATAPASKADIDPATGKLEFCCPSGDILITGGAGDAVFQHRILHVTPGENQFTFP